MSKPIPTYEQLIDVDDVFQMDDYDVEAAERMQMRLGDHLWSKFNEVLPADDDDVIMWIKDHLISLGPDQRRELVIETKNWT